MISDQPARYPKIVWDLATPVRALRDEIGADALRELSRPNASLDWALLSGLPVLFAALWWLLTEVPAWGFTWWVAAALQALVIFNGLYVVRHDCLFHRRIAGKRVSYLLGVLLSVVMLQPYAEHELHGDHHKHVGWDLSEEFVTDLDRRWKRWFSLTIVGMASLAGRKLRPRDAPRPNDGFVPPEEWTRGLRMEKILRSLFLVAIALSALVWPEGALHGYVLPIALFGPAVILARFAFQHGETDPDNPFHVAVLIRTGAMSRALFLWALADCHAAHHFFPGIPMYRLGRAADLIHPILLRHGVPERSFGEVMNGLFVRGYGIRTRWPADAATNAGVGSVNVRAAD